MIDYISINLIIYYLLIMESINNKNSLEKEEEKNIDNCDLKNVLSNYIIKNIFYFINKKITFKLIIHNKYYQNKLNINLKDYQNITGKYIIIEENTKAKEYTIDENDLIFEGEYSNKKEMEKEKNIIIMILYYLRENI